MLIPAKAEGKGQKKTIDYFFGEAVEKRGQKAWRPEEKEK